MPRPTRVALFVPCYVDQMYPQVAMATVDVLERLGLTVDFPEAQTCCGQPMANTGCDDAAAPLARRFVDIFSDHEYVVCPSGSCTAMVRQHYDGFFPEGDARSTQLRARTFELCEFLTDVLGLKSFTGRFPHRVGLHQSCHGLRELRLGPASELVNLRTSATPGTPPSITPPNKARMLLAGLEGVTLTELSRPDECCGFGGTFAVAEESVSCMMGLDRIADHERAGTEVLTAGDMSCLMHLEGLLRRQKKNTRVMHIAQILAEAMKSPATP